MNPASPDPVAPARLPLPRSWGLFAVEAWVLLSAWCSLTGWALSACGRLDTTGYFVGFLTGGILFFLWIRRTGFPAATPPWKCPAALWRKRFSKPLPLLFLAAALLALAGGILYRPVNYDALTYRVPRIYNWLAEGRWHWIHTINDRMNFSGTGYEWLMTPLLLLARGDRLLFLASYIPFLLLPAVTFSCFREMGVRRRVAWYWMWLLPLGHCFILQSAGIGNDSFAAVYLLASIAFALRARRTDHVGALWISCIAIALVTGSKVINLPLLLPFVIAAWPAKKLLLQKKAASLLVVLACAVISFLPLAVGNQINAGGWAGDPADTHAVAVKKPLAGLMGNGLQLLFHNFEPPLLASLLTPVSDRMDQTHFIQSLRKDFHRLGLGFGELPDEEAAGAGLGLSLLFVISLAAWLRRPAGLPATSATAPKPARTSTYGYLICLSAWISLGAYMAKVGSESGPRLVAAYYPLCFALALIHPGNAWLTRRAWWRTAAALAALCIFPALILNPSRPLWPARSMLPALAARHPQNAMLQRANTVYEVYSHRADVFAPIDRDIPPGTDAVAFLGADDPSASLWLPFGGRRVIDFSPGNESRVLAAHPGILLVTSGANIEEIYNQPAEDWIAQHHARIAAREPIIVKIHRGAPEEWLLLELRADGWTTP